MIIKSKLKSGFIGQSLKDARLANGLDVFALSRLCGVSQSAIYSYESGRSTPKPDVMTRLSDVLGVQERYFFIPIQQDPSRVYFFKQGGEWRI